MTIVCPHCKHKSKFLSSDFCGEFVVCKGCYQPILWESIAEDDGRHDSSVKTEEDTSFSMPRTSVDRLDVGLNRK